MNMENRVTNENQLEVLEVNSTCFDAFINFCGRLGTNIGNFCKKGFQNCCIPCCD